MNKSIDTQMSEKPKRGRRWLLWTGLALIIVVAGLVGSFFAIRSAETSHLEEAKAAFAESNWEQALGSLEQVLGTKPAFLRHHILEATALRGFANYQLANYAAAQADVENALTEDPEIVDLQAIEADIHFKQDTRDLALQQGEKALDKSDMLPEYLLAQLHANQAVMAYQGSRDKDVTDEVSSAVTHSRYLSDETLADLYAMRAISAARLGDAQLALDDTRLALSFNVVLPDEKSAPLFANKATILYERGQSEEVMEASRQALDFSGLLSDDSLSDLHLMRAQILYDRGELTQAIEEADTAASIKDDLALPHSLHALDSYLLFDEQEAMDEAEATIVLDPENVLALRIRGSLLAWQGDVHGALEDLEQALDLDQDNPEVHAMCVKLYLEMNRPELAQEHLERAIEQAPNEPSTLWAQALVHENNYEFEMARAFIDQAISLNETRPEFFTTRSRLYDRYEDLDQAQSDLESALFLNPDFADAQAGLLLVRSTRFDHEGYEEEIQTLIDRQPEWAFGRVMLARHDLWIRGDTDRAAVQAGKVVELLPDSPLGYVLQGYIHLHLEEYEQATDAFELALEKRNNCVDAMGGLAELHLAQGEFDEALELIKEMKAINPESISIRMLEASAYVQMGDLQSAWEEIHRILDEDPGNPLALMIRSEINLMVGDDQEAMIDLTRALDDYPASTQALLGRSSIYYLQGKMDSARQYADQALEIDPQAGLAHGLLSDIAMESDDPETALAQAELWIEKSPEWGWAYHNQGMAHILLEEFDDARDSYTAGLEVADDDDFLTGFLLYQRALVNFTLGNEEEGLDDFEAVLEESQNIELLNDTENLLDYPSAIPRYAHGRFLVEDDVQQFTLSYSPDWERYEDDPENGYVLSLFAVEEDAFASVDVFILDWPAGVSLLANIALEAMYESGTYSSLSLDSVQIAGRNGLVRHFERTLDDGTTLEGRHYYVVQGGRAAIIVVETTKGAFDQYVKEFEAIAESFAFLSE